MHTISLKLPKALLDRLAKEANNRRRSKSAVIRDCLDEVLWDRSDRRGASCYTLAPHLAGSVKGSRDLSTNKQRLKRAFRARLRHR